MQAELAATRAVLQKFPMIPALKATVAHFAGDPDWVTVRPPLVALTRDQQTLLVQELRQRGFQMPDLAA